MGAYKYCDCNAPLSKPTPREDLLEGQICTSCGNIYKGHMRIEEWLVELYEEVGELQGKVERQRKAISRLREHLRTKRRRTYGNGKN